MTFILKDNLEIILFTFNRDSFLKTTMEQLLSDNSPVKNINITIYDNNSNDNTQSFLTEISQRYTNIKYIRNYTNIGAGSAINSFLKKPKTKYFWLLADDDIYNWSNWNEVENAMKNDSDIICTANYLINDKTNMAQVLQQMTFYPSNIYKTDCLLLPEVIGNICAMNYTMFWQFPIISSAINHNKSIYICDNWIVNNGMIGDEDNPKRNMIYTRDLSLDDMAPKRRYMSWIVGYANALSMLWDKKLVENAMEIAYSFQNVTFEQYCKNLINENIIDKERWPNILDVYIRLSHSQRKRFRKYFINICFKYNKRKILKQLGLRK